MGENSSVDDIGCVSPDRVRERVAAVLRVAQQAGLSDETLESLSGIKARRIKSYRVEGKMPSLDAALSLAVAIGPAAVNSILSLINYAARPLDDPDAVQPMQMVADGMKHFAVIADAAADNRIDHTEAERTRVAADGIIATFLPLSSAGRA